MGVFTTAARPNIPYSRWADLMSHRPSVELQNELLKRFAPDSGHFFPIEDAYGDVNLDLYMVQISKLPTMSGAMLTPEALLRCVRLNINAFVGADLAYFEPYEPKYNTQSVLDKTVWESESPVGAVLSIDLRFWGEVANVDDGSVVCSLATSRRWVFSTLHTPEDGAHPVSGNREFGFFQSDQGLMFYTRGADRLTNLVFFSAALPGFLAADSLWKSFQEKLAAFVEANYGTARPVPSIISDRRPWGLLEPIYFKPTVPRIK